MEVKVPKKIKLLSHEYDIVFNVKQLASTGCGGLTQHLYQRIILDNRTSPHSELVQVFLHELIHIVERRFCIKMEDPDVERLSEGLAAILVENFGLEFDFSEIEDE